MIEADTNPTSFSGPTAGFPVDGTDFYELQQLHLMGRAELESLDDRWLNALQIQHSDVERDSYSGPASRTRRQRKHQAQGVVGIHPEVRAATAFDQTLTGAIDYERDNMQNTGPGLNAAQALKREVENTGLVGPVRHRVQRASRTRRRRAP